MQIIWHGGATANNSYGNPTFYDLRDMQSMVIVQIYGLIVSVKINGMLKRYFVLMLYLRFYARWLRIGVSRDVMCVIAPVLDEIWIGFSVTKFLN